jgi:hypothetical protein
MISSLTEHTRKCLKFEYLGRIEYDFEKSRVTGSWDHKDSVSAKKVSKKIHACVPLKRPFGQIAWHESAALLKTFTGKYLENFYSLFYFSLASIYVSSLIQVLFECSVLFGKRLALTQLIRANQTRKMRELFSVHILFRWSF